MLTARPERSAKRILIVGPRFSLKPRSGQWLKGRAGLMFYSLTHRLANGFIRNGHFVLSIDDRDYRKQALGVEPVGAWLANRRLLQLASELRPDLVCLHNCDLISTETVNRIREIVPRVRVAVAYCDNIFSQGSAARFRKYLEAADFGFATTAGPALAQFADACPVAFIPNPFDVSIDNGSAYSVVRKSVDVFCACGVAGESNRWDLIDELCALRPDLRYALYGRNKQNRLYGDAYYRMISQSKIGLNINREEGNLYASDRMAQYLGNGILLATSRRSGYQRYFGDDEMLFFDSAAELANRIDWAISDDRRWRSMAKRARDHALTMMGGELVTEFMLRMTLGWGEPKGWQFSNEIYSGPVRPCAPTIRRPAVTLLPQYM